MHFHENKIHTQRQFYTTSHATDSINSSKTYSNTGVTSGLGFTHTSIAFHLCCTWHSQSTQVSLEITRSRIAVNSRQLETVFIIRQHNQHRPRCHRQNWFIMWYPLFKVHSSDKSSRTSWPRGQNFVLGLELEHLSSACPRTFYFGLVKMNDIIGNRCKFTMIKLIIYQSYLLTYLVLLI